MATQIIDHRSRDYSPTLNFAATENNLSWAFTQEGDGEIYSITTTNVATLSIDGSSVSLPFSTPIAVVDDKSYPVVITKINNGQTASVTIDARRANKKTVSISVPDFGTYNRRYNFILRTGGIVEKTDFTLLHSSNYTGGGTFTINPIVQSITLPSTAIEWQYCAWYIDRFGVEKVMVVSCPNTNQSINACIVDVATGAVTDLAGNANAFTNVVFGSTSGIWNITGHGYDYINNIIYFKSGSGTNADSKYYNITTNSLLIDKNPIYPKKILYANQITRFNPIKNRFAHHNTDFNYSLNKSYNYTFPSGSATVSFFNRRDGLKYVRLPGDVRNIGEQSAIDEFGAQVKAVSTSGPTGQNGYMSYNYVYDQFMAVSGSVVQMQYVIRSTQNASVNLYGTTQNIVTGDTYLREPYSSGVNEVWAAFGNIKKTRLYLFDRNQSPASYGYLDFATQILSMTVTGYEE